MTLTVHHLQVGQSERIIWLCEELGIDYTLKLHKRDPIYSPQSIKDLHPLGQAPIIQDGDLTLAESSACADYIIHKHGNGRLALPPSHPDYAKYLYWFHFANGTMQPALIRPMTLQFAKVPETNDMFKAMIGRFHTCLRFMDDHLSKEEENPYLAGKEFTAADIMNIFTLTTMRAFYQFDISDYKHILAYLKRLSQREGFRRMREKGDPGMDYGIEGPPPKNFLANL